MDLSMEQDINRFNFIVEAIEKNIERLINVMEKHPKDANLADWEIVVEAGAAVASGMFSATIIADKIGKATSKIVNDIDPDRDDMIKVIRDMVFSEDSIVSFSERAQLKLKKYSMILLAIKAWVSKT